MIDTGDTAISVDEPSSAVGVPTLQDMSIPASEYGVEIPF